jgi:hypothetical protein
MSTTTRPVRRTRTAAAVLAVTALLVGGAACGADTAQDGPAAPAQHLRPPMDAHSPTSADSAERRGHDQPEKWLDSPTRRPVLVP